MNNPLAGLRDDEVRQRQADGRFNQNAQRHGKPTAEILIENIFSVFNIINLFLIGALVVVYISVADKRLLLDSIGIFSVVILNTLIALVQEFRARRLLERARLQLNHSVTVIRNGCEQRIDPSEIVEGDTLRIERGDYVVVDGPVFSAMNLEIDESLLTGESLPVLKRQADYLYSGSFCVAGTGYYTAEAIGGQSYAASVTAQAQKYKFVTTPLQKNINRIFEASFAVAIAVAIVEISLRLQSGLSLVDIDFVRFVATIVFSLVPESLVLFSTISFAVGVHRVGKLGAIVQKLNAIESFSTIDTVCLDKTGTLTQNRIALREIIPLSPSGTSAELESQIRAFANASSDRNASIDALRGERQSGSATVIEEMPFSSERKYSAMRLSIGAQESGFILGALDILSTSLSASMRASIEQKRHEHNVVGQRSLLFAAFEGSRSIAAIESQAAPSSFEALAIVVLSDPLREEVGQALDLFQVQEIKLKVLSGDSRDVVLNTLQQAGWRPDPAEIGSGEELDRLSGAELAAAAQRKNVFVRLSPRNKLDIVRSLGGRSRVAMIGDGVNDVPAMKQADLGIAMEEGSSITREIADIVLRKNKFSLLPAVFDEGRHIISAVLSIAKLYLTKNLLVLFLGLFTVLFAAEFPLTPRRSSLLSVIAVTLPVYCITAFDRRKRSAGGFFHELFGFLGASLVALLAAGYLALYIAGQWTDFEAESRAMIFLTVLLIVSIANYLYVVLPENEAKARPFLLSAGIFLGLYIILVSTELDLAPLNWIRTFFELGYVGWQAWAVIVTSSGIGLLLLLACHKVMDWLRSENGRSRQ